MWWIALALALAATQEERVPDRVGRVLIEGNTDTPTRVILRCLALRPGEVLDYTQLPASRDRLKKSGLFGDASIEVVPNEFGGVFKDILVRVEERPWNWALFAAVNAVVGFATLDFEMLWDAADRIRRHFH